MTDYKALVEEARIFTAGEWQPWWGRGRAQRAFGGLADAVEALVAEKEHLQAAYDEMRTEYEGYRADRKAEYQSLQDWAAKVQQAKALVERPGGRCVAELIDAKTEYDLG
jgi:hypothetical protein